MTTAAAYTADTWTNLLPLEMRKTCVKSRAKREETTDKNLALIPSLFLSLSLFPSFPFHRDVSPIGSDIEMAKETRNRMGTVYSARVNQVQSKDTFKASRWYIATIFTLRL